MEEHKLAEAAADAVKVIKQAEEDASYKIAIAASEAAKITNKQYIEFIEFRSEMKTKLENLQKSVDALVCRDDKFTLKEDFVFWRNILISGIILSIFLAVALGLFSKLIK